MLASDSDDETGHYESFGYILGNQPNQTNLLDVEQSKIYQSFRFDKDQSTIRNQMNKNQESVKQSNVKQQFVRPYSNESKLKQSAILRQSTANQQLNKSSNQQLNKTSDQLLNKSSNQQLNKTANQQLNESLNQQLNKTSNQQLNKTSNRQLNKTSKFDKTDDLSSFDCEIPSELYSVVDGRQVFRLFNHVEHVKDHNLPNSKHQNCSNESSYKSVKDQSNYLSTIDSNRNLSKEHFRANTLPDESRFCNFLNQTKFDTLIEENSRNEFKTLTDSSDQIVLNDLSSKLNGLSNDLNDDLEVDLTNEQNKDLINNSKNISKNKSDYSNYLRDKSNFNTLENENNCLKEIINYFDDENKRLDCTSKDDKINKLSKIDEVSRDNSKSIDNTKENDLTSKDNSTRSSSTNRLTRNSIKLRINLTRNQATNNQATNNQATNNQATNNLTRNQTTINLTRNLPKDTSNDSKQSSNYEPSTLSKFNEESLDVFRDFSSNMAKLNETKPSYLKNLESINESRNFVNLADELSMSMNFSPIKPTNKVKDNFFKTPLRRPLARSTNQTQLTTMKEQTNQSQSNQPVNQINKEEFFSKDKLQSTFVERPVCDSMKSCSRRSRLNEERIRQNVESELQKLKLMSEQSTNSTKEQRSSNLTKLMEQPAQSIEKSNRTSDLLEKTRNKIEEFKRQQLEKSKLNDDRTSYDSTLLNIFGKDNRSELANQLNANQSISNVQRINSKYSSRLNYLEQPHKTVTIDQSEIDNDKFRLIEAQLKQAELSRSNNSSNRFLSSQSLQNLKDKSRCSSNEITKTRSTKSASSISRPEDILSFVDSSEQTLFDSTLVGSNTFSTTANQNFTLHNSNLEEQKTYLKFLNTQLIKVKDLEDKSRSIKRRSNEKKSNHQSEKPSSIAKFPVKRTDSSATESTNSLKTISLNTISPSSIDLSEHNLDSILESSEELNSLEDDKTTLSSNVSRNNNSPIDVESSFHCKCCQRNKLKNDVQIQTSTVFPTNLSQFDQLKQSVEFGQLNRRETEQYKEFSEQLGKIQSNTELNLPQINRKQTFNKLDLLIDRQINGTFSRSQPDKRQLKKKDKKVSIRQESIKEDQENEDLESSFNLNNQSLDETFKIKCPQLYNKIHSRRNVIHKKMQKRKESEMKKVEDDQQLRKNLNTSQLNSNLTNRRSAKKPIQSK